MTFVDAVTPSLRTETSTVSASIRAVTRPKDDTIALAVSLDDHAINRPATTAPDASRSTAVSWAPSPSSKFKTAGVSVMLATGAGNRRNDAVTEIDWVIATEQVALPLHAPVHPSKALPLSAVAVSRTVVPNVNEPMHVPLAQLTPVGAELTVPAPAPESVSESSWEGGATVIAAVPRCPPDDAVIVDVPTATDVTVTIVPVVLTVATVGLLLVHMTDGADATPADVLTVAVSWPVWPTPVNESAVGAITTEVVVTGGVRGVPLQLMTTESATNARTGSRAARSK